MKKNNNKVDNQTNLFGLFKKTILNKSTKDNSSSIPTKSEESSLNDTQEIPEKEEIVEKKVTTETLMLDLEQPDMPKIPLSDEELEEEKQRATTLLTMKTKNYEQLALQNAEGNGSDLDAEIYIYVAQHRMAAWAFVFPPLGNGNPLRPEQVKIALQEYSISAGIGKDALDYLVREQPYFKLVPIAYGTPAEAGKDGKIIEKYPRTFNKTFQTDARGNMDYRTFNNLQIVHAGDVICERILPTPGKDGIDVLGTVIPAKDGKDLKLSMGKNTNFNEDKTKLLASMDGQLQYLNGCFNVNPVLNISGDVDLKVGNINFTGDVRISGDVMDGFVIQATGSVFVQGLVEGAVIEAGKDIVILKGILGDEKAVLKAGRSVKAQYIENCSIYAGDSVESNSIISSTIHSGNKISVCTGRGTIIGGKLTAAHLIESKVIGCRAERNTVLIVGENPCSQIQKEELQLTLEDLDVEKKELERSLQFFTQNPEDDMDRLQLTADTRLRISILSMREQRLLKEMEKFELQQPDLSQCRIYADEIYPITTVQFQHLTKTIKENTTNAKIHIENDEIEIF